MKGHHPPPTKLLLMTTVSFPTAGCSNNFRSYDWIFLWDFEGTWSLQGNIRKTEDFNGQARTDSWNRQIEKWNRNPFWNTLYVSATRCTFFCITGEYTAQYLIHIWILTILSLAPFIKFYYLYKAILLLTMFLIYSILISQLMPSWTMGM